MNIKRLLAGFAMALCAGSALAIPVPFTWSGGSISATGALAIDDYDPTSGSVTLDDGVTFTPKPVTYARPS